MITSDGKSRVFKFRKICVYSFKLKKKHSLSSGGFAAFVLKINKGIWKRKRGLGVEVERFDKTPHRISFQTSRTRN